MRIKGGGSGIYWGKRRSDANWTEQQRSKPPQTLTPPHSSASLFTLKTLSSNRSYLKKPAGCKMYGCHACVELEREFWICSRGCWSKVRWGGISDISLSWLLSLFMFKKTKQKKQANISFFSSLFTPYSNPTT